VLHYFTASLKKLAQCQESIFGLRKLASTAGYTAKIESQSKHNSKSLGHEVITPSKETIKHPVWVNVFWFETIYRIADYRLFLTTADDELGMFQVAISGSGLLETSEIAKFLWLIRI
jgi:hypothetical protein